MAYTQFMDSGTARKLLRLLRPFDPHQIGKELGPEFLCATKDTLERNGFHVESLSLLSPSLYDGKDYENKMDNDRIINSREVHVFLRSGLEQIAGVAKDNLGYVR